MGTAIDIYWRYAQAGDHYLGRLLAGYSPNEKDFDTLPPHFTVGLDHPTIDKAMTICFGNILDKMKEEGIVPGLLLRCLASVVWHSDDIVRFCSKVPGTHHFMALPLFQDPTLLAKVKELVTVKNRRHLRYSD